MGNCFYPDFWKGVTKTEEEHRHITLLTECFLRYCLGKVRVVLQNKNCCNLQFSITDIDVTGLDVMKDCIDKII